MTQANTILDAVVVGGGPAGLSAGIYLGRSGRHTLIVDKGECTACRIDRLGNYLGFPEGISGRRLIEKGRRQAEQFGCQITFQEVIGVGQSSDGAFRIETEERIYDTRNLILATGAAYEKPHIKNLAKYEGKGVSYCVQCDGYFFRDKPVAIIGAGNLAVKEMIEMHDFTNRITLLTNGEHLEVSGRFQDWVRENPPRIRGEKIESIIGGDVAQGVRFSSGASLESSGIFIALGSSGAVGLARRLGAAVSGHFVDVNRECRTSLPRVYAAGDCTGRPRQIAVAMGAGAEAAINLLGELRSARK